MALVRLGKPLEQADLARALVMSMRPEAEVVPFRPKVGWAGGHRAEGPSVAIGAEGLMRRAHPMQ